MSEELCRICLSSSNLLHIFECVQGENLSTKIMKIADVQISVDDGLPSSVCCKCSEKINSFVEFKQQIEDAVVYLESLKFKEMESKIEISEIALEYYDPLEHGDVKLDCKEEVEEYTVKMQTDQNNESENVEIIEIPGKIKTKEDSQSQENSSESDEKPKIKRRQWKQPVKRSTCKTKERSKSIQCSVCGRLLSSRFRLECHMRTHTGERPFKCTDCDKTFAARNNLKMHFRVHTGEKPWQCKVCLKRFAQTGALVAHARQHTGESPYQCHLCPKKFKCHSHMKYHIRLHTGERKFACDTCQRAFTAKSDLRKHEVTHTGEKKHVCTICGMRISRSYHLRRHMLIHTRDKKFKCDICDGAFAKKCDLTRHMIVHEVDHPKKRQKKESNSKKNNAVREN